MSFMYVAGVIYHCTKCGSQLQVDYQGGAMMTQVGELAIIKQQRLSEEFTGSGVRPDTNDHQPLRVGLGILGSPQYLHAEIICEDCFAQTIADESELIQLRHLLGDVDGTARQAIAHVYARCEKITLSDVEGVIGKPMFDELSGRSMLPARKQRKLNEVFQKWFCLDEFLSRCINESLAEMPKPLPDKQLRKFVTTLNKQQLTEYIPKEIGAAECLNPFICIESAVRVPLPNTPTKRVFYKNTISLHQFKSKDYLFILKTVVEPVQNG